MVRVLVLRGVIASGDVLVADSIADISDGDARILASMGKVRVLPPAQAIAAAIEESIDDDSAPPSGPVRETATRGRRRSKAQL